VLQFGDASFELGGDIHARFLSISPMTSNATLRRPPTGPRDTSKELGEGNAIDGNRFLRRNFGAMQSMTM
jgi:hypothetical protein